LGALSFLKLISATISVFQIKQVALTCDLNLLDAAVLNLTHENGDATTVGGLRDWWIGVGHLII
jgi:hypothetical protein